MVLESVKFFRPTASKGRPLLNQIPLTTTDRANVGFGARQSRKVQFWNWFKTRPELNSPVQIRVDDTITEVEFTDLDGGPLGRNKLLQARKFWNNNFITERLKSMQYDRLVTGSGFLWLGRVSDMDAKSKEVAITQLKEACKLVVKNRFKYSDALSVKEKDEVGRSLLLKAIDEDIRRVRKIDYVASSTMIINHDQHDVLSYIQRIGGSEEEFNPREIIHLPLLRVDGKVDGFSPVESLVSELILIWAIKENMLAYFRNGGSPSKAYILPTEIANTPNHEWLTQELQDQGVLENRHGNLILTGDVKIEDLEPNIKDMDYKELALYVTSNVAYALRIPVGRIPYMIGSAQSGSDAGGLAESGYWSMIESDQRTIETPLNTQIFDEMGFNVRFKKQSQLNDLRIAQADNARIDWVTKVVAELRNKGKKIKNTKFVSLISGMSREVSLTDLEDMNSEEMMSPLEKTGLLNRSFAKDSEVMPSEGNQNVAETKKQEGLNNAKKSNQTGA